MSIHRGSQNKCLLTWAFIPSLFTFIIFHTAIYNDFVDLDDLGYIVDNRHLDVFNWQTVVWAFTSYHEANWHPLTMLSLAFDRHLFGINPAGFHLINVILHSVTAFVAFYVYYYFIELLSSKSRFFYSENVLKTATVVAVLLFAVHPLRVESVVWASERKDVLFMFFSVSAIWFYLRFISHELSYENNMFCSSTYWMVLILYCFALMSKPTAVTLPLLLFLIDYYPLCRIFDRTSLRKVVYEKIPLVILSGAASLLTISAQQYAMTMAPHVNITSRIFIACKAYLTYLWKMLIPIDLSPYYPHPGNVNPFSQFEYLYSFIAVSGAATVSIILFRRNRHMCLIIFLFSLVSVLPMLGLIQVGGQWIADRYTYLFALGISLPWGGGGVFLSVRYWVSGRKTVSFFIVLFLVSQLTGYALATNSQIKVWRNNETLASREIELYPLRSGAAYYARAKYRKEHGECLDALHDIDNAFSIALRNNLTHKYADLSVSRAEIYICLDRISEALSAADWAVQTSSDEERSGYLEYRNMLVQKYGDRR